METILIVEDDRAAQKTLKRLFETEGYCAEISADGESALEAFRNRISRGSRPRPAFTSARRGKDVCREIRQQSPTLPIVVLSAVTEEADKVLLFELGADDYVTKPFSPRELLARVQTAIRRTRKAEISEQVEFDGVCVDFTRMEASFDGRLVGLTSSEFKVLKFLVTHAARVVPRDQILSEVFGYGSDVHTRTIDTHILKLRQKLERNPNNPVHILTLRGLGYKFVP